MCEVTISRARILSATVARRPAVPSPKVSVLRSDGEADGTDWSGPLATQACCVSGLLLPFDWTSMAGPSCCTPNIPAFLYASTAASASEALSPSAIIAFIVSSSGRALPGPLSLLSQLGPPPDGAAGAPWHRPPEPHTAGGAG